jgi:hypothetical protein
MSGVPTTRYFAVGYFTAAQHDQRGRDMLSHAAGTTDPVTPQVSAITATQTTIFEHPMGDQTLEMQFRNVATHVSAPATASGAHFVMERFNPRKFPPAGMTPQEAFTQYLASPDGRSKLGAATAVQLFAMDIDVG